MPEVTTKNSTLSSVKVASGKEQEISRALSMEKFAAAQKRELSGVGHSQFASKVQDMFLAGNRMTGSKKAEALDDGEAPKSPRGSLVGNLKTFRQAVNSAKNAQTQLAQSKAGKAGSSSMNPGKRGTAMLLKASWLNLIDSFGATLIYINLHAFALFIPAFRNVFCALGEEWLPKDMAASPALAGKVKKIAMLEKMLIAGLDFIVLCVLLFVVAILVIVVNIFFASWLEKMWLIFENWELFNELVKML